MDSLTQTISLDVRSLLQTIISFVWRHLKICARWTARWIFQAFKAISGALKLPDLLHSIQLAILWILKWCGIALVTIIGVPVAIIVVSKCIQNLLQIYCEKRRRRLEERRQDEERRQHAAYMSTLQARRAAEAAALKKARFQQAREEAAIKNRIKIIEEQKQAEAKAQYARWETECERVLHDKSSMTQFPFPPLPRCTSSNCTAFLKTTPWLACQHNFRQFLQGSGKFSWQLVKHQRTLWHEDRFVSCREDLRVDFKKHANSLFVILQALYEDLQKKNEARL